jgi:hypothetical protein
MRLCGVDRSCVVWPDVSPSTTDWADATAPLPSFPLAYPVIVADGRSGQLLRLQTSNDTRMLDWQATFHTTLEQSKS